MSPFLSTHPSWPDINQCGLGSHGTFARCTEVGASILTSLSQFQRRFRRMKYLIGLVDVNSLNGRCFRLLSNQTTDIDLKTKTVVEYSIAIPSVAMAPI